MSDVLDGLESRDLAGLHYLSQIQDLVDLHDFMGDDSLGEMIDLALQCLMNPNMKHETAARLLIRFQAASVKFATLAITFTTIKKGPAGTENNIKKNVYYTLADQCDKMAGALKYIVRRNDV